MLVAVGVRFLLGIFWWCWSWRLLMMVVVGYSVLGVLVLVLLGCASARVFMVVILKLDCVW